MRLEETLEPFESMLLIIFRFTDEGRTTPTPTFPILYAPNYRTSTRGFNRSFHCFIVLPISATTLG